MNRALVIGAGGVVAVIVVALAIHRDRFVNEPPPLATSPAAPSAGTTAPPATVATTTAPAKTPVTATPAAPPVSTAAPPAASGAPTASVAPAAAPPEASSAPSFDVVRVAPSGSAVIAGRAAPNAEVTVRDGDVVIGQVTADPRGEWVLLPERPLQPGNRSLTLAARVPGKDETQAGTSDVLIAVPQPQPQHVAAGATPSAAPEEADTGQAATALALLVPHAGGDVARPLQVPGQSDKGLMQAGPKGLALDIIEYDSAGEVALAGRAEAGTAVNLYLDDKLVAEARAGSDGHWSAKPSGDIAAGLYQLRIDALGRDGRVASRLALPFQRAEAAHELAPGDRFTVQPGNSLWRIARRSYGSGMRYAVIFAANRDQIADPNRIYPGQVVKLPAVN